MFQYFHPYQFFSGLNNPMIYERSLLLLINCTSNIKISHKYSNYFTLISKVLKQCLIVLRNNYVHVEVLNVSFYSLMNDYCLEYVGI